jgi:hypothetical protein
MKNKSLAVGGFSVATVLASANASAYDWSTITSGVDFSGEIAGIAAIVGVIAGVLVVRKGARYLLGMLK